MVKFAKGEDKPFDPISNKLLSAIASAPQAEPSPAPPDDASAAPEVEPESPKKSPKRSRKAPSKPPTLKVLTSQAGRGERLTRVVRCLFTPSEERELRAMVARLASEAGTSLNLSHLIRPYFDLLLHCEEQLAQELRKGGITRPLNDKTALALFERQLAEVIHNALKKSPLLHGERLQVEE
jgi:hypothetical protein